MAIKVHIHKTHRIHTGDQAVVESQGQTVGECLQNLVADYPGMREALFEPPGQLHKTVEIYINLKSAFPDELQKPVADGDELHLIVMLAGG